MKFVLSGYFVSALCHPIDTPLSGQVMFVFDVATPLSTCRQPNFVQTTTTQHTAVEFFNREPHSAEIFVILGQLEVERIRIFALVRKF